MVCTSHPLSGDNDAVNEFITKHQKDIFGTLSGFDRVRFWWTFRVLAVAKLLLSWLTQRRVLIKDFRDFAASLTQRLKGAVEVVAQQHVQQRDMVLRHGESPIRYLQSSQVSKEVLINLRELCGRLFIAPFPTRIMSLSRWSHDCQLAPRVKTHRSTNTRSMGTRCKVGDSLCQNAQLQRASARASCDDVLAHASGYK